MEKFTRFQDKGTGIVPFIPKYKLFPRSPVKKTLLVAGLSGVVLLRAALFGLLTLLWTLLRTLAFFRGLIRVVDICFCKLILACTGVYSVEFDEAPRYIAGLFRWKGSIQGGDVIVCNNVSFLQVFVLAARFSPVFTTSLGCRAGTVRRLNVFQALSNSLRIPTETPPCAGVTLEELSIQSGSAPIVVFPEGVRSNCSGVLQFLEGPLLASTLVRHACAVSFPGNNPSGPAQGIFSQLSALFFRFSTPVRVRFLPYPVLQQRLKAKPDVPEDDVIRETLALLLSRTVPPLQVGAAEYFGFLKYWGGSSKKQK